MFNPLLYIIQTDRTQLMNKIDIPLLEIFYHTFTCFEPKKLFIPKEDTFMKNLSVYQSSKKPVPTRHSRFLPNFKITTSYGVNKLVHKLDYQEEGPHINQKKQPVRRK